MAVLGKRGNQKVVGEGLSEIDGGGGLGKLRRAPLSLNSLPLASPGTETDAGRSKEEMLTRLLGNKKSSWEQEARGKSIRTHGKNQGYGKDEAGNKPGTGGVKEGPVGENENRGDLLFRKLEGENSVHDPRVGEDLEVTVGYIRDSGAAVFTDDGTRRWLYIGEITNGYVDRIDDYLQVGDRIRARVIPSQVPDRWRVSAKAMGGLEPKYRNQSKRPPLHPDNDGGGERMAVAGFAAVAGGADGPFSGEEPKGAEFTVDRRRGATAVKAMAQSVGTIPDEEMGMLTRFLRGKLGDISPEAEVRFNEIMAREGTVKVALLIPALLEEWDPWVSFLRLLEDKLGGRKAVGEDRRSG